MSKLLEIVQELLKLPQSLCNTCGKCCRIAVYKGCLSYEEVKKIAADEDGDPFVVQSTKDFLSIFEPYESPDEARKMNSEFVDGIYKRFGKDSKVTFFHCRYINDENKCIIHENRPELCRAYPIVSERTIFFNGCGYEEKTKANLKEIMLISDMIRRYKENPANCSLQEITDTINKHKNLVKREPSEN